MNIFIIGHTRNYGPYSLAEIIQRLKMGEFTGNDLAQHEGLAGAIPLSEIIAGATKPPEYAPENLIRTAVKLTTLVWIAVLVVPIAYLIIPQGFDIMAIGVAAAFHIWGVITACQLARIMRKPVWLWAVLTLVPFVNLFAYARIISLAAKILKCYGIRTSIAGVARSVRWTPTFRPLSAENKMNSRGLLSWLLLLVGR